MSCSKHGFVENYQAVKKWRLIKAVVAATVAAVAVITEVVVVVTCLVRMVYVR